jgi:hypothetical protein
VHWRRKAADHDARVDSVEQRGNRAVVVFSWADRDDNRHRWAHVLELRDGKVIAIKDCANPSRAALATRLRTALSG